MEQSVIDFLLGLVQSHPYFAVFVVVQSFARTIFKPLHAFIDAFILATPSKVDDEKWAAFLKTKAYWVIDYIFSLKLGPKA